MESFNAIDQQFVTEVSFKYLPELFASFSIFFILMYFASPFLSAKYVPKYNELTLFQKGDWNTRMVSTIHAVTVSILSAYNMINDTAIENDKVWGTSDLSRVNVCIICGYLLADLIVMILWFPLSESWIYFIHHFAVLYSFLYNVVYGVLTYFANLRILAEFSTVFVNNRWILSLLGYKSSTLYVVNGTVMLVVFFLCRIAILLPYYAVAYQAIGRALATLPIHLIFVWLPCGVVMDFLNLYWFQKMFKGAVAMFDTTKQNGVAINHNGVKED